MTSQTSSTQAPRATSPVWARGLPLSSQQHRTCGGDTCVSSTPGPRLTFLLSSCLPWKPAAGCGLCVYLEAKAMFLSAPSSAEMTLLTFQKAFRDLVAVGPSGRLLDSEVVGHFVTEGVRMEGWPLPPGSCSASDVILQALWGIVKHRPDPGALWLPLWP